MPIEGRTLGEAARAFRDYLNGVLARTVAETQLVLIPAGSRVQVAFRRGGQPVRAPLYTRFGAVGLYLGQVCEGIAVSSRAQRLVTVAYTYTLTVEGAEERLLRWEYVHQPPADARWCRHHLQGNVPLQVGRWALSLNDLHTPTGYVTIEEILRFCIVDLGVQPRGEDWHAVLETSYRRFKDDFAPRGEI